MIKVLAERNEERRIDYVYYAFQTEKKEELFGDLLISIGTVFATLLCLRIFPLKTFIQMK